MHNIEPDAGRDADPEHGVVVFLNGSGGRVLAGRDDASSNRSRLVSNRNLRSIHVPSYSDSTAGWDRVVGCVQRQFEEFNVDVVAERPRSGDYIMAMVGGAPAMLGYNSFVAGVAPYNGRVNDNAVVFVFEQIISSERRVCESIAHEVGHALGLDHTRACSDTMSYGSCGAKSFVDKASTCGEYRDRSCATGARRQNSYQKLATAVGTRRARRPGSSPTPSRRLPRPKAPPRQPKAGHGPQISILAAKRQAQAGAVYEVKLRARDQDGIAGVELLWSDGRRAFALRCGNRYSLPITCRRRGDVYTFALRVGHGHRAFAVRSIDGRGNVARTKARYASFR